MLHSSSITARVNRKILGVTNTGETGVEPGHTPRHGVLTCTGCERNPREPGARRARGSGTGRQDRTRFTKGLFKKNLKKPTHSVQPSHPRTGKTPRGSRKYGSSWLMSWSSWWCRSSILNQSVVRKTKRQAGSGNHGIRFSLIATHRL
jgi:hypothetical protein